MQGGWGGSEMGDASAFSHAQLEQRAALAKRDKPDHEHLSKGDRELANARKLNERNSAAKKAQAELDESEASADAARTARSNRKPSDGSQFEPSASSPELARTAARRETDADDADDAEAPLDRGATSGFSLARARDGLARVKEAVGDARRQAAERVDALKQRALTQIERERQDGAFGMAKPDRGDENAMRAAAADQAYDSFVDGFVNHTPRGLRHTRAEQRRCRAIADTLPHDPLGAFADLLQDMGGGEEAHDVSTFNVWKKERQQRQRRLPPIGITLSEQHAEAMEQQDRRVSIASGRKKAPPRARAAAAAAAAASAAASAEAAEAEATAAAPAAEGEEEEAAAVTANKCCWRGTNPANGIEYSCTSRPENARGLAGARCCAYHTKSCLGKHPQGFVVKVQVPNSAGLCNSCFLLQNRRAPDKLDPFHMPGVHRTIIKRLARITAVDDSEAAGASARNEKTPCAWKWVHPKSKKRYVCRNAVLRGEGGVLLPTCGWHTTKCVMPHPNISKAVGMLLEVPNEHALCVTHFMAKFNAPPQADIGQLEIPGVEHLAKGARGQINTNIPRHPLAPRVPFPEPARKGPSPRTSVVPVVEAVAAAASAAAPKAQKPTISSDSGSDGDVGGYGYGYYDSDDETPRKPKRPKRKPLWRKMLSPKDVGYMALHAAKMLLFKQKAALTCQRVFRGWRSRHVLENQPKHWAAMSYLDRRMRAAACCQRQTLRVAGRRRYEEHRTATLCWVIWSQKRCRGWLGRLFVRRKRGAKSIQGRWRCCFAAITLATLTVAREVHSEEATKMWDFITIQRYWRGALARWKVGEVLRERARRAPAATHIQRLWRGVADRAVVRDMLIELERRDRASLVIERYFRGHRWRKAVKLLRLRMARASLLLQRLARGFLGRTRARHHHLANEAWWGWASSSAQLPRETFAHLLPKASLTARPAPKGLHGRRHPQQRQQRRRRKKPHAEAFSVSALVEMMRTSDSTEAEGVEAAPAQTRAAPRAQTVSAGRRRAPKLHAPVKRVPKVAPSHTPRQQQPQEGQQQHDLGADVDAMALPAAPAMQQWSLFGSRSPAGKQQQQQQQQQQQRPSVDALEWGEI